MAGENEAQPAPAPAPERPEYIPEKFWDPAAGIEGSAKKMAEAYSSLEQRLGTTGQQPPDDSPESPQGGQDARERVEDAGLDFDSYSSEFAENGELSDESFRELEEAGLPRELVQQYIAGQQAQAEKFQQDVFSLVGGQEQYQAITEWAKSNLSDAEKRAFNAAVSSGDYAQTALAVQGLQTKYSASEGKAPALVGGQRPGQTSHGYASRNEVVEAMKDPRYGKDDAYTKEVYRRLDATKNF